MTRKLNVRQLRNFVLCAAILTMLMSGSVFAAIGNAADLNAEITAATSGDTIILDSGFVLDGQIAVDGKDITIDLAAQTINTTVANAFEVKNGGSLTVTNGSITTTAANLFLVTDGDLILDGGTFDATGFDVVNVTSGDVEVNDATLVGDINSTLGDVALNGATITGDIELTEGDLSVEDATITGDIVLTEGDLSVEDTAITGDIDLDDGDMTIDGASTDVNGTIDVVGTLNVSDGNMQGTVSASDIGTISGGTFDDIVIVANGVGTISGGTFDDTVTVANGVGTISGGTFGASATITVGTNVGTITGGTFDASVSVAGNVGTITGGTFDAVTVTGNVTSIIGGTFNDTVTINGTVGAINGGTFKGDPTSLTGPTNSGFILQGSFAEDLSSTKPTYLVPGYSKLSGGGMFYFYSSSITVGSTVVGGEKPTPYSVTYNANGGIGTLPVDSLFYGTEEIVTVLDATYLEYEGYTFLGWSTVINDEEPMYVAGDTFEMGSENVILYAIWMAEDEVKEPEEVVEPSLPFDDVDEDDWYFESIEYCYDNGLFTGLSETVFAPYTSLNRAMFVTVLWRLEGEPAISAEASFNDVPADTWYSDAVAWAAENEIVTGYSETAFGPNDIITREQMAIIMMRYSAYKGENTEVEVELSFNDASTISDWALDGVRWAYATGLMIGREGNNFAPQGNANRAEAATILFRYDSGEFTAPEAVENPAEDETAEEADDAEVAEDADDAEATEEDPNEAAE